MPSADKNEPSKITGSRVVGGNYTRHEQLEFTTGSPSSLYEPHRERNMASNCKALYGIFYKISMKVVKSENIQ